MSYYEDERDSLLVFGFMVILIVLMIVLALNINSCVANAAIGGTIVDKYRDRWGNPVLVVELDDNYSDFKTTEEEYLEYDIGEIYAQEQ